MGALTIAAAPLDKTNHDSSAANRRQVNSLKGCIHLYFYVFLNVLVKCHEVSQTFNVVLNVFIGVL